MEYEFDIRRYLKEVSKHKVLSHEEQAKLAKRVKEGDAEAVKQLVTSNLRFVVTIAKKCMTPGLPISDAIQEGNIGLLHAAKKYDYTKGYHFTSYAIWWIKQKIGRASCDKSRAIRLPINRNNLISKIRRAEKTLTAENNREPSLSDISEYLKVPLAELSEVLIADETCSLEAYSSENPAFSKVFRDYRENPERSVETSFLREELHSVITSTLTEKEADIVLKRSGINGNYRKWSLEELADCYGVTRERIRAIEKEALKKLRNDPHAVEILSPYIGLIK